MQNVESQEEQLDLDADKLAEFSGFWRMLITEHDKENNNIAEMLNSEQKYGYFMLSLLSMWYEHYGWPALKGHYISEKLPYSAAEFDHEDIAKQVAIAAGNIPANQLLATCLCTITKHQVPVAMPLLTAMLETINELDDIEYWVDILKIAFIGCINLDDLPMKEVVALATHGGRSGILSLRMVPIKAMRIVLMHQPEYAKVWVEFTQEVLRSILHLRQGKLTEDDNIIVEEVLFGIARSAPMEADALCSKYGPKLSSSTREKIKAWHKGQLHMCNSDLKRDYDNLFGVLERGVLYLEQWKAPGDCDEHDHDHHHHHGHGHHHHH